MTLRALILAWPEPSHMASAHRGALADSIRTALTAFPPDAETPTPDAPIPSCAVAATLLRTEPTYTVEPWPNPPLTRANRVLLLEGPDPAVLRQTASDMTSALPDPSSGIETVALAVRQRIYTSLAISAVAYDNALARQPRSLHPEVMFWPCNRTGSWWRLSSMQRQALLLPRLDERGEILAPGHIQVTAPLVPVLHRRLYHQHLPSGDLGYMLGWFETAPEHLDALKKVVTELQDSALSPDHAFYQSAPLWWGRRTPVSDLLGELDSR